MNTVQAAAAVAEALAGIAPEVDLSAVDPEASLRTDLDLDSLDFLSLVQKLHESTGVDIPEVDYARVETLSSLTAYLEAHT